MGSRRFGAAPQSLPVEFECLRWGNANAQGIGAFLFVLLAQISVSRQFPGKDFPSAADSLAQISVRPGALQ
jgi:hypothetical protein